MAHLERINVQIRYFTLEYGGLSGLRVRQSFFFGCGNAKPLPYDAKQVDVINGPAKRFSTLFLKVLKKRLQPYGCANFGDTTLYSVGRH